MRLLRLKLEIERILARKYHRNDVLNMLIQRNKILEVIDLYDCDGDAIKLIRQQFV